MLVSLDRLCTLQCWSHVYLHATRKKLEMDHRRAILWIMEASQLVETVISSLLDLLKDLQKSE